MFCGGVCSISGLGGADLLGMMVWGPGAIYGGMYSISGLDVVDLLGVLGL